MASTWRDPRTRWIAAGTVVTLAVVLAVFSEFLLWVEQRDGVVLDDPVLRSFAAVDVSWLTFSLIYIALLLWIGLHVTRPRYLLVGLQSYAVLVIIRIGAMWLTPLDPPTTSLPLIDRLVESLGPSQQLTKDLFFSGHTSTLFLLGLSARTRRLRVLFFVLSLCVAVCVVYQHAHYAIDVYVAPFIAFGAWSIVTRVWRLSRADRQDGA